MKVLNLFTRLVGKVKTTDSQSGYRAYSRRAMETVGVNIDRMKEILVERRIKLRRGAETVEEMEEELKG